MEAVVRGAGFSPVKGMRHLALDHVDLDRLGAVGDRALCLVDVGQRRVLRTVQHPSLMGVVATTYDDGLRLSLPTGEVVEGPVAPSGETITCDYWGRQVVLELADGPHADADLDPPREDRPSRAGATRCGGVRRSGHRGHDRVAGRAGGGRGEVPRDAWRSRPTSRGSRTPGSAGRSSSAARRSGSAARSRAARSSTTTRGPARRTRTCSRRSCSSRPTNRAGEPMFGVYATVTAAGRVDVDALTHLVVRRVRDRP